MKTILLSVLAFMASTGTALACPGLREAAHGLSSGYINGKGQFAVSKMGEVAVSLSADYNNCGFDDQGEPSICTEMAPSSYQGALVKKQESGAATVYAIENSEFGLVCWQSGRVFLVKFDDKGHIVDSIRLLKD